MTQLVIGVGGNGTHSVLGYLHLCRLLNEPMLKPLKPLRDGETQGDLIVFDADKKSNLNESLCRKFISVYPYAEDNYWIDPNPSYISRGSKFWGIYSNEPFMKYLFEEYQLDIDIFEGYTGNPPVGATVMYNKIKEEIEKPIPGSLEEHFKLKCDERLRRVIFIGSFIGGTGAGAVPAMARFIKNRNKNTDIVYLAHSDWFLLESKSNNINSEILKRNVVGGMSFLTKEAELFKTRVLLDYKNEDMVIRQNDGPGEQLEKKDFMYLLAGFLIRGYLRMTQLDDGFFGICLNDVTGQESILNRFIVKDNYINQNELFAFRSTRDENSLYNRIQRAYKAYFYLTYFCKWLSAQSFTYSENPLPDDTEAKIKKDFTNVSNTLLKSCLELKQSLLWLESLNYPDSFKPLARLPYRLDDFPASDTLEHMYDYLHRNQILDPLEIARELKIDKDTKDVPGEVNNKIWTLVSTEEG